MAKKAGSSLARKQSNMVPSSNRAMSTIYMTGFGSFTTKRPRVAKVKNPRKAKSSLVDLMITRPEFGYLTAKQILEDRANGIL